MRRERPSADYFARFARRPAKLLRGWIKAQKNVPACARAWLIRGRRTGPSRLGAPLEGTPRERSLRGASHIRGAAPDSRSRLAALPDQELATRLRRSLGERRPQSLETAVEIGEGCPVERLKALHALAVRGYASNAVVVGR